MERFLEHPAFHTAAQQLFGAAVVRPEHVYVNLNPPLPKVDPGHVDVPCFRGATRGRLPVWLLQVMQKSELFTAWYVPTATAVAWFYAGEGGGFMYWPDGPDAPPLSRPCLSNTALMGDNDYMFHAVEAVGGSDREVPTGLTLDATLRAIPLRRIHRRQITDGQRHLEMIRTQQCFFDRERASQKTLCIGKLAMLAM